MQTCWDRWSYFHFNSSPAFISFKQPFFLFHKSPFKIDTIDIWINPPCLLGVRLKSFNVHLHLSGSCQKTQGNLWWLLRAAVFCAIKHLRSAGAILRSQLVIVLEICLIVPVFLSCWKGEVFLGFFTHAHFVLMVLWSSMEANFR